MRLDILRSCKNMSGDGEEEGEGGTAFVFEARSRYIYPA